ncbi:glutamate--tRNA ligase [Altibacter sp. HG106]|uniref:glutamate--tRNA ligase n=1 Tax=Altibacter sp. HG106 TaxID=3023937 RepID=UPI002350A027|nr:glutamate--tRNA ligase [Altibacter sp. HG106]MDC7994984.1 glutamate--tRNA ligase [Altibacter sp. HG106]
MSNKVRVRFAPSPTGPLHIGGVRTALFNYLFAKKHQGTFVLRIEDTDQTRYVPGAETYILEALKWLNIAPDEGPNKRGEFGPYRQSERKNLYKTYVDQLIESGHAYYAFDSSESLEALRKGAEASGGAFSYDARTRNTLENSLTLSAEETQQRIDAAAPFVVRFKTPENETLAFSDRIRGAMEVNTATMDDKVLFKSDGMPTYHMANIVDDHLMEITHVIRGEEWLPSLPLHLLLYRAFGWEAPEFAHLPLIMKPVGKGKLSKRDGEKLGFPVFPLEWKAADGSVSAGYREEGYLPEAVINMLALLGWNPGSEQELFTLNELVEAFDLSRVNKSGAKFDPEKTKWFQHHYLQQMDEGLLTAQFRSFLQDEKNIRYDDDLHHIVALLKERATFVADFWEQGYFFFLAPDTYDEKALKKAWKEDTASLLEKVITLVEGTTPFTAASVSDAIKGWIVDNEIGFGKVMMPLRLSLVGAMQGPDVFEIVSLLGKGETTARMRRFIASQA